MEIYMKGNRGLAFRLSAVCTLFIVATAILTGCASYKQQVTPIRLPAAYGSAQRVSDMDIAAKAYNDAKAAESAFGFDIRGAGVLPVEIVFDNKGNQSFEIISGQTFLEDDQNNLWPILDSKLAYDRIAKKTELGKVAPKAAEKGALVGIAGAVIGGAIGIVTGQNVGEAVLMGAVIGTAAGATAGGIQGYADTRDVERKIGDDLKTRTLENKPIPAKEISYGFLFFPGESAKPKGLRLKLKEKESGTVHTLIFGL